MKKIILLAVGWIAVVNLFGLLALNRINMSGDSAYTWINPSTTILDKTWDITSLQTRWDSFFYIDIASNGYSVRSGENLSNIVFFPLYPFLIKALGFLLGNSYILAGWIISSVSLIGSAVLLDKFIKRFHREIDPSLAISYLLIFPTALFFNAIYTESLFLLVSLATFYFMKKHDYWLAGFVGFLASLTRVTGVLLILPMLWEIWANRKSSSFNVKNLFAACLMPLGTGLFFLYHYIKFNDLTIFFKVESAWGRSFTLNEGHLSLFSNASTANFILDVIFVSFALITIGVAFYKKWTSYAIYMLATVFVALSTGTLMSIGRYILVLFPMYIILASVKNKNFQKIYSLASVMLLTLYIILFVNSYWAG